MGVETLESPKVFALRWLWPVAHLLLIRTMCGGGGYALGGLLLDVVLVPFWLAIRGILSCRVPSCRLWLRRGGKIVGLGAGAWESTSYVFDPSATPPL